MVGVDHKSSQTERRRGKRNNITAYNEPDNDCHNSNEETVEYHFS